jgi:hypothetical protein
MVRVRAAALAAALVLTSIVGARPALATDPATAQALFDQAERLMSQERWTEACAKLEESQRLDPAGGTLLHLATCRENEGRIATAWALYQDALIAAKKDGRKDRAKVAQKRIDALAPRLPRLRVHVAFKNRRVEGFKVLRDEVTVGEAQWDETLPVDPGTHHLTARGIGRKPWHMRIDVPNRADEIVVEVPELEIEPRPDIAHGSDEKPPPTVMRLDDRDRGSAQRTVGIIGMSLGGAGIIFGSVFGVLSIAKASEADDKCAPPDRKLCTPEGKAAGDEAITRGNISTIGFIVGGALVVGGVALYFTAPTGSASIAVGPGNVGLSGRF